ncbi:hypothetical protein THAOC_03357, partial [Thalassiosira oceanica]
IGKISAEQWGAAMEDEAAATGVQGVCPLPIGMKREDKGFAAIGRGGFLVGKGRPKTEVDDADLGSLAKLEVESSLAAKKENVGVVW